MDLQSEIKRNNQNMSSLFGFSIVVCCYNSSKKIGKTLEHLFQLEFEKTQFEIILVNNNSHDDTVQKALNICELKNTSNIEFSVLSEMSPGLNFARISGAKKAKFDLIVFCDDDNWLQKDYLCEAKKTFDIYPKVDLIGGNPEAVFEKEKPEWFEQNKSAYACATMGEVFKNISTGNETFIGAGLIIKKNILIKIYNAHLITTDRKGVDLSSGGDNEICLYAKLFGAQLIYNPKMKFKHYMTEDRLNWSYCCRLYTAFGKSESALQAYHFFLQKEESNFSKYYKKYFLFHLKKLLQSPNRLYFFLFSNRIGEEYIPIYNRSWSTIKYSIFNYGKIKSHYQLLTKIIENVDGNN